MNQPTIICFGEVLWDMLPSGKVAGGAPMNVAFHANNFGIQSKMISRIGEDDLGKELHDFLNKKGVDTELIQYDTFYPTGTVKVNLDEKGTPTYKISKPAAWDYINLNLENVKAIKGAEAFVFGSLAARHTRSKETLFRFLELAKLKVFDVNLRAPFYSKEIIENLLKSADIVKMNEEELALIGTWLFDDQIDTLLGQKIKRHFEIDLLIITKGGDGAFLIDYDNNVLQIAAKKVTVKDTIGSGDSFLAGFLFQLLNGEPLIVCLDFATRTGALVATKRGGTPQINEDMVAEIR